MLACENTWSKASLLCNSSGLTKIICSMTHFSFCRIYSFLICVFWLIQNYLKQVSLCWMSVIVISLYSCARKRYLILILSWPMFRVQQHCSVKAITAITCSAAQHQSLHWLPLPPLQGWTDARWQRATKRLYLVWLLRLQCWWGIMRSNLFLYLSLPLSRRWNHLKIPTDA